MADHPDDRRMLARASVGLALPAPDGTDRRLEGLVLAWARHEKAFQRCAQGADLGRRSGDGRAAFARLRDRHNRREYAALRAALAVEPTSPRGLLLQSYLLAALAQDERGDQARPALLGQRLAQVLDLPRPFG